MSDVEVAPVPPGSKDVHNTIQIVLRNALSVNGLVRGIHESAKTLDKRQALLCLLAENCDEAIYKKLICALCAEHHIPLIKVDNNKKLGEWSGLCKLDNTGKARKVVGCSCVVIKDWGEECPALDVLRQFLELDK